MIAIIDCCGSNTASVQYALERINVKSILTTDPSEIQTATHVILPGVGQAKHAMRQLQENNLIELICDLTQPVLGICLGMQLFYEKSEEGNIQCLGIIPGEVKRMPNNTSLTVPHMGWNTLETANEHRPLLNNIVAKSYVYFVHSYYAPIDKWTIAETQYAAKFTSMVKYKNFVGMQFHPEKSSLVGEQMLLNFIESK